jgi:hypothetical protein
MAPYARAMASLLGAGLTARRGGGDEAVRAQARVAAQAFAQAEMPLHASAASWAAGEGGALAGVRAPERFARMLAPGLR